ncbi:MAG TPA: hypothetical protein VFY90_14935 [Tepidiformaceae bacterium]|jgi:hypothetical protein|nr:hypothetical protein [Candidatus Eisenbacteria bacterium]HEX6032724.1 hypothetical protein [Tepidiformaceae bacterium]
MSERERDLLLEAAASAHREIDREGRIVPPPAWYDMAPEQRVELFQLQLATRAMERAVSGASGTVRSVLRRIAGF